MTMYYNPRTQELYDARHKQSAEELSHAWHPNVTGRQ